MFKLIIMAKRKPGMSMDEFRDYYEKRHAVLVRKITPMMRRYRRNYLTPLESALAAGEDAPFDCVTEAWFDSEGDFQRSLQSLVADTDKTTASKFAKQHGLTWMQGFLGGSSDAKIPTRFGVSSVPAYVLIDPAGKLVSKHYSLDGAKKKIAALLDAAGPPVDK